MKNFFEKTKKVLIASLVFVFSILLVMPASADVGLSVKTPISGVIENVIYGNATGGSGGNSLLLLQDQLVDRFRVDRLGNATANGTINGKGGLCMNGDCKASWAAASGSQWTTSGSNIYFNTGNVGIGTANVNAWNGNFTGINIGYNSSIMSEKNASGDLRLFSNAYYDGAYKYISNGYAAGMWLDSTGGDITFEMAGNGTSGSALSWNTPAFQIKNNGNVGIGGTPTQKFHIQGGGVFYHQGVSYASLLGYEVSSGGPTYRLTTNANEHLELTTGGSATAGIHIKPDGNVGIGTVDPTAQMSGTYGLAIYKSTYPAIGFKNDTTNWLWYGEGATFKMWNASAGDILTGSTNGRIGIGTTNPVNGKLEVQGGAGTAVYGGSSGTAIYGNGATGVYGNGSNYGVSGSSVNVGVYGVAPIVGVSGAGSPGVPSSIGVSGVGGTGVSANGTSYDFRAENWGGKSFFAGKVGIGTTNPGYNLDVSGDARADKYRFNASGIPYITAGVNQLRLYYDAFLYNTLTFTDGNWNPQGAIWGNGNVVTVNSNTSGGYVNLQTNGGYVGIGTTNPIAKLDVEATATAVYGVGNPGIYGYDVSGYSDGIYGYSSGGNAIRGQSSSGIGVYGQSGSGWGGYFDGKGYFSGRVGIGTASFIGNEQLLVQNDADGSQMIVRRNNSAKIASFQLMADNVNASAFIGMTGSSRWPANRMQVWNIGSQQNGIDFNVGGTTAMQIDSTGKVGIGVDPSGYSYKFIVNGQPAAAGYTTFTNYSDSRLKKNISYLPDGYLAKVLQLKPSTFNYNSLTGYDQATQDRTVTGFIAQDVQKVFPDMVGKNTINGTEYLDTNLSALPVYIVKAMQEQQKQIEELKAEVEVLKAKIK